MMVKPSAAGSFSSKGNKNANNINPRYGCKIILRIIIGAAINATTIRKAIFEDSNESENINTFFLFNASHYCSPHVWLPNLSALAEHSILLFS
jgi:hypothetical protein